MLASLLRPYNGRDIVESVFWTELIRKGEHSTGKISEQYNVSEEKYWVAFYAAAIMRYSSLGFIFEEKTNNKIIARHMPVHYKLP